jgi:hypothetical protein
MDKLDCSTTLNFFKKLFYIPITYQKIQNKKTPSAEVKI